MSNIDLRNYVVAKWGRWHEKSGSYCADQLRLTSRDDGFSLAGPLRVRVSVTAMNTLTLLGASKLSHCEREAFGYVLDIPPGQTWSYPHPKYQQERERLEKLLVSSKTNEPEAAQKAPADVKSDDTKDKDLLRAIAMLRSAELLRNVEVLQDIETAGMLLGTNAGFGLVVRVAGPDDCGDPCAAEPCATIQQSCSCGCVPCKCPTQGDGLPCNFAQRGGPNWYFPSACEPCTPGAMVGVPPSTATALLVSPAAGGTVRTRFFNGMFITREDLETDQRNVRLKRALMNRAMGQGVAWGFEVSANGESICVLPGYGVDCCGNDVVLSAPYRVSIDSLVRDPAAAAALGSGRAQAMSLILEYFECPEQPRPVHGDPCSTDVTRCETSRIRETVRLRLGPPAEVDDSGCIKDFLSEIEKLRSDPQVAGYFESDAPVAGGGVPTKAPSLTQMPFTVQLDVIATVDAGPETVGSTGALTPPLAPAATVEADAGAYNPSASTTEIAKITVSCASGFTLTAGAPAMSSAVTNVVTTSTSVSWQVPLPPETANAPHGTIPTGATYLLQNWTVQDANGNTYSAPYTEIDVATLTQSQWKGTTWANGKAPPKVGASGEAAPVVLHVMVLPTTMTAVATAPVEGNPFPCLTEACDPSGAARFKVVPPWLHANPEKPAQAADPRVLALALTYAFIAGEQARLRTGPNSSASSAQLRLAEALYNAVFRVTFATAPDNDRFSLSEAVEKLLQCWCKSLLYPGPKCLGNPHGVVVGCARVEGGRITMVDPWGGRRWIMHYPLLAYWGQQFGIMPPDAIASRLFDMICCIGCLGVEKTAKNYDPVPTQGPLGNDNTPGRSAAIPLGSSMLFFDDAKTLSGKLTNLGIQTTGSQTISPVDFAMKLWDIANGNLTTATPGNNLVDYVPLGFPDMHLLAPSVTATPALAQGVTSAGALDSILRSTVTSSPAGWAPPPLLRSFTTSLSKRILQVAPLEPTDNVQHAAAGALANAGVTTIAELLSRDPDTLLQSMLTGANADGLNGLVTGAEATARTVASDVAETTAKFAALANVTARGDMRDPTRAANLSRVLADRLATANVVVTPEIVGRAVTLAAAGN